MKTFSFHRKAAPTFAGMDCLSALAPIRAALVKVRLVDVATATGITYRQLVNIRDGKTKSPTLRTFVALQEYFGATAQG